MKRVDTHENNIFILINQLDNFLRRIAIRQADKSCKPSDTMVGMHNEVAGLELVQLFQSQCHLTSPCLVTFQIIFVETVEYLMIGKETTTQRIIGKPFMQCSV